MHYLEKESIIFGTLLSDGRILMEEHGMNKITHPIFISIQQEATGKRMRQLFQQRGYSVRDVQAAMGFENPQAIYKWLAGRSLPSIDNLVVLSLILHVSIEEILVVDGDFLIYLIRKSFGFLIK